MPGSWVGTQNPQPLRDLRLVEPLGRSLTSQQRIDAFRSASTGRAGRKRTVASARKALYKTMSSARREDVRTATNISGKICGGSCPDGRTVYSADVSSHVARWIDDGHGADAGHLVEVVALPLALPPVSVVRPVASTAGQRVFADAVDVWLRPGGWRLGSRGAGSVALRGGEEGEPGWLKDAWADEVRARAWSADAVRTMLVISYDETRFYWWAAR